MQATIQTIFVLGFTAYAAGHALPSYIRYAAWCLMHCRTARLGGHIEACPEGHYSRNHYNSCRHRICPLCAFIQVQKWLARQKARILATDHYHVIFTIPHELNVLWAYNTRRLTEILFTSSRDTILELLADQKYLGAKAGIIASLHTWSKTLTLHPHIHCLVTGGGLSDGKWRKLFYDYLFPIAVARILFRAKVLEAISDALRQGNLRLPANLTTSQVRKILKDAARKKWNVHIRDKYRHGKGVLSYLARYLRGGTIANRRLVKISDNKVTFHIGREKQTLLTLSIAEFLHRFLQHVPLPGMRVVRSYGLYASASKAQLAECHKLFGTRLSTIEQPSTWQEILENTFAQNAEPHDSPWLCPICGKRLITQKRITPSQPQNPSDPARPMSEVELCRIT